MSNNSNQPKRKYDDQFKQNALKMVDNGQSVRSVASGLGIGENLLHRWKAARRSNGSELEKANAELRARVKQLELEREMLKKALSIFSRQT